METLQIEFYKKLSNDKVKINWNKNPIRMDLFLSFLKVETVRSTSHLGHCTGWTQHRNDEIGLIIVGGNVNGVEWLDRIEYKTKLQNPYNNFVNPFYLLDILTEDGIKFFLDYFKEDIDKIVFDLDSSLEFHARAVKSIDQTKKEVLSEIIRLNAISQKQDT